MRIAWNIDEEVEKKVRQYGRERALSVGLAANELLELGLRFAQSQLTEASQPHILKPRSKNAHHA